MPLVGKSQDEIKKRRQVKIRFVELARGCATTGPRALIGGTLTEEETSLVAVAMSEFWHAVEKENQTETLRTAKGFSNPPKGLEYPANGTVSDLVKQIMKSPTDVGCVAGVVHDAVLWAGHVIDMNPNSFTSTSARADYDKYVDQQKQRSIKVDRDYEANPLKYGQPLNVIQARAWLTVRLGQILLGLDVDVDDSAAVTKARPQAVRLWETDRRTLRSGIRDHEGVDRVMENYEKIVANFRKDYGSFF